MNIDFYHKMAATAPPIPLATHLILHEQPDPDKIIFDGERLGKVMLETARRFNTTLAFPLMDLALEKDLMLQTMGVVKNSVEAEGFLFSDMPTDEAIQTVTDSMDVMVNQRMKASCEAISYIAENGEKDGIIPIGMSIGPFSLLTKLMNDPITAVFMAGSGMDAEDDESIELAETMLTLSVKVISAYWKSQAKAGAKAMFNCEPAANLVYFSPKQIDEGSKVFEHFVIEPNKILCKILEEENVDFLLHDCGELTEGMIRSLSLLNPKVFSFGSSVNLWEAESYIDKDIVLFGNLPSKKFYSDEVTIENLSERTKEIVDKLKPSGHPFIIASECDILAMKGYENIIMEKVVALNKCKTR